MSVRIISHMGSQVGFLMAESLICADNTSLSGRRWEMMTPEIKREIDRALVIQSGGKIEDMAALLADKIKSISVAHFGGPENGEVLDLNESRELAAPFVAQSYRKVAERYKQIARL